MTTWHKGPPPEAGLWIASSGRCDCIVRHFNGKEWSLPFMDKDAPSVKDAMSRARDPSQSDIEWLKLLEEKR